jgi:hypothetical protein
MPPILVIVKAEKLRDLRGCKALKIKGFNGDANWYFYAGLELAEFKILVLNCWDNFGRG